MSKALETWTLKELPLQRQTFAPEGSAAPASFDHLAPAPDLTHIRHMQRAFRKPKSTKPNRSLSYLKLIEALLSFA